MSLTKGAAQAMEYELSGSKTSKNIGKRAAVKNAQGLSSGRLVWILVSRHKVGLLMIGNIVLVLNFVFPEWTEFVKSVL